MTPEEVSALTDQGIRLHIRGLEDKLRDSFIPVLDAEDEYVALRETIKLLEKELEWKREEVRRLTIRIDVLKSETNKERNNHSAQLDLLFREQLIRQRRAEANG